MVSFRALSSSLTVLLIGSGTIETIQSLNCLSFCMTNHPRVGALKGVGSMVGSLKDVGIGSYKIFSGSMLLIVYCILGEHKCF